MNRDRFLLFYGVDPQRWSRRYGIEPASVPCYECGAELFTSIPFAQGDLRGLIAPRCKCGFENTPYCVVHTSLRMDEYLMAAAVRTPKGRAGRRKAARIHPL